MISRNFGYATTRLITGAAGSPKRSMAGNNLSRDVAVLLMFALFAYVKQIQKARGILFCAAVTSILF